MLSLNYFSKIYLYRDCVDMRKAINGLSQIVQDEMKLDPFTKTLFIFCGRRKDRIKILYWDNSGFALWQKRLEEEKYFWPKTTDTKVELTTSQLQMLLDGFNIWKLKPHSALNYKLVS